MFFVKAMFGKLLSDLCSCSLQLGTGCAAAALSHPAVLFTEEMVAVQITLVFCKVAPISRKFVKTNLIQYADIAYHRSNNQKP